MKAIIEVDVPEYQIGREVSIYFKDTMMIMGVVQEPKKGHWIDGCCSICGSDIPAYIIDWKWQKDMDAKYCPMCGARMTKGKG